MLHDAGGQAKRCNIGIALLSDPRIIFLDEPTSGLDSYTSHEARHLTSHVHMIPDHPLDRLDAVNIVVLTSMVQVCKHLTKEVCGHSV